MKHHQKLNPPYLKISEQPKGRPLNLHKYTKGEMFTGSKLYILIL